MSEPVFLKHSGGLTLGEIAALTGAERLAVDAAARRVSNIAALDLAGPTDLTVLDNPQQAVAAQTTRAGGCLTTAALARELPPRVIALIVPEPYGAFVAAARALFPHALRPSSLFAGAVAPGAQVHATARLEDGVTVEPGAVIGAQAEIGSGTLIGANAVVGPEVRFGRDGAVGAGTCISNALVGDRVIIHAGCSIGQEGFGFVPGAGHHLKMPQVGRVIIQDNVEIGAGTTIDRGGIRDTVIGEGTKIDNLVRVGHNACIGRHCIVTAQTGVVGGSMVEDFAVLGARAKESETMRVGE